MCVNLQLMFTKIPVLIYCYCTYYIQGPEEKSRYSFITVGLKQLYWGGKEGVWTPGE